MTMCAEEEKEEGKEGAEGETCQNLGIRRDKKKKKEKRKNLVPLPELSAELLMGSAKAKRSGSSREVSGDVSPSISFSVASQREKMKWSRRQMAKGRTRQWGKTSFSIAYIANNFREKICSKGKKTHEWQHEDKHVSISMYYYSHMILKKGLARTLKTWVC